MTKPQQFKYKKDKVYSYWGRVKIGYNLVFSWTAVGFGHISFYDDRIIVYAFPFRKSIPYLKIKRLVWSTAGYIKIEHEAKGMPFVAFYLFTGKNSPQLTEICKVLKSKRVTWD